MRRAGAVERDAPAMPAAAGRVVLRHDERRLRRKALTLEGGGRVLVDLAETTTLRAGDRLVLEDGTRVAVAAAAEPLLQVTGRDRRHLVELAWHIGNRHLAAEIAETHIRVIDDHVVRAMLEGLGAGVAALEAPFEPARGAYHAHAGAARHAHDHDHDHRHAGDGSPAHGG
ncbi:urease accessory protein UreE [Aquibium sp. A9E412]|uniref:urease accessory protein UreE n=1 Tax=Aquibium sp. A9E412 TaxID=2976767 RepID=UPI0025B24E28|nr:urease accessory protein UreE [Aquibium sp. A9E412]MDN2567205.1 urease accessory protein UreE [Aquibium sp. A9E412]